MRKRVLWIGVICLCLLAGCDRSLENTDINNRMDAELILQEMEPLQFEDPETENLADMLQQNGSGMMVQIGAGTQQGSGVIYGVENGKIQILTAAHVLEDADAAVRVTFGDGFSVACSEFSQFDIGDVGVVLVECGDVPEENMEHYLCANVDKESFDKVQRGDGCIVMGSRSGVAAEAYEGEILDSWIYMEDYDQYMMWVKAEGKSGMSGGGLFDRQGHFLGILSGGNENGELAVVPLSLISLNF